MDKNKSFISISKFLFYSYFIKIIINKTNKKKLSNVMTLTTFVCMRVEVEINGGRFSHRCKQE